MENKLNISLEFNSQVEIGSKFTINLVDQKTSTKYQVNQLFVENRVKPNQVVIGKTFEDTLQNLTRAMTLDYSNIFKSVKLKNGVLLEGMFLDMVFVDAISLNPISGIPFIKFDPVVIPWNPFQITNVSFFQPPNNNCSKIGVRVTTSQAMTAYCIDYNCSQTNSSTIDFFENRGLNVLFRAIKGSVEKSQVISMPSFLEIQSVTVNNTPFGATAIVNIPNTRGLNLQYSLDNLNWRNENSFNGLDFGNYVVYVKDQFGCLKNTQFSVLEINYGTKPIALISKENSFRFKEPVSEYLNDENQFFHQSFSGINYCYVQDFLNTDVITTQFKSNFKNISVYVKDLISNQINQLPLIKKTNNIELKQKFSKVKKYKINNFQFGLYFESGNLLDYDSNAIIENYHLNGSLPIWAKLNNFISINEAYYQITSIGFDENVNSEVLIFDGVMSNQIEEVVVSCVYNIQDYEVYEFELNFNYYSNTRIQIEIINSDPNFGSHNWISEEIQSNQLLKRYLEIKYYNSTNTNILYSTGIQHLLRLPFNTIKAVDSDSSENYKTDTNTHLLDSKIYEITEFDFMPFPLELWRKLKIALSVDTIFIDGVGYSKNAEFTKESLGSSNLYKVTAQMSKNGFVFNSNLNSNEIIIDNAIINIPGLISANSEGYISF